MQVFNKPGPDRYFLLFDLCALAFAAWLIMFVTGVGGEVRPLVALAFTLLLLALFSRDRRDEFAEHCWRTATSVTFLMLIIAPIGWAFVEGLILGFTTEQTRDIANAAETATGGVGKPYEPSFDGIVALLFATFFATFEWTRFRGGAR